MPDAEAHNELEAKWSFSEFEIMRGRKFDTMGEALFDFMAIAAPCARDNASTQ